MQNLGEIKPSFALILGYCGSCLVLVVAEESAIVQKFVVLRAEGNLTLHRMHSRCQHCVGHAESSEAINLQDCMYSKT